MQKHQGGWTFGHKTQYDRSLVLAATNKISPDIITKQCPAAQGSQVEKRSNMASQTMSSLYSGTQYRVTGLFVVETTVCRGTMTESAHRFHLCTYIAAPEIQNPHASQSRLKTSNACMQTCRICYTLQSQNSLAKAWGCVIQAESTQLILQQIILQHGTVLLDMLCS